MSANPTSQTDAPYLVDQILDQAVRRQASDVHVEPTAEGYEVRYRIDGLLEVAERHDPAIGRSIVNRLMVMAHLLSYRLDIPQEGRMTAPLPAAGKAIELRLAIMPTACGLRAAVRMPAEMLQPRTLQDLQLPPRVLEGLQRFANAEGGMLLLTGPAGSGKTTTIYALLQYIAQHSPGLSIIALEDPVERILPGVTQIEVSPFGQLTYERALRSILRQDPQVLMLGEIRDSATACLAMQAALSGHSLISTLHAGNPGSAVARLFEMGIEPYQVASSLFGVVSQRLLRQLSPAGGYRGRLPVAEMALVDEPLRQAILRQADAVAIQQVVASQPGYQTIARAAADLVSRGLVDQQEVLRVLGGSEASAGRDEDNSERE